MKAYQTTTATPDTLTPQAPGELTAIVTWTFVAFVLISGVVGGMASLIANDFTWQIWRLALLAGLLPALLVAGLLAFASFRRIWNAIETLTGLDLNGDGAVGEPDERRLLIVNRTKRSTIEGVDADDLREFIRVIYRTGDYRQATWKGRTFNSGRKCNIGYHTDIMRVLATAGIVADYGDRRAGHLAIEDVEQALRTLNL